jgi:hypothetical protein
MDLFGGMSSIDAGHSSSFNLAFYRDTACWHGFCVISCRVGLSLSCVSDSPYYTSRFHAFCVFATSSSIEVLAGSFIMHAFFYTSSSPWNSALTPLCSLAHKAAKLSHVAQRLCLNEQSALPQPLRALLP